MAPRITGNIARLRLAVAVVFCALLDRAWGALINSASFPAGGMNPTGGDAIVVAGTGFAALAGMTATATNGGPTPLTFSCVLAGDVSATCTSTPGFGANYTFTFRTSTAAAIPPANASAPPIVAAYAPPLVTSATVLGTISAGSSLPLRVAGNLVIDLVAADYDYTRKIWDNRATSGAPNTNNGDFGWLTTSIPSSSAPTLSNLSGVLAVNFAYSTTAPASLSTVNPPTGSSGTYSNLFTPLYGRNAWSHEVLVYPVQQSATSTAWTVNTESPLFQWGTRPGNPYCSGGDMGVGFNTVYGAGGLYGGTDNCDIAWQPSPLASVTCITASNGNCQYRPSANVWHHIVMTYSGWAPGGTATLSIYLDGVLNNNNIIAAPVALVPANYLFLGSWSNPVSASSAIALFRSHTGALAAGDVAYNFQQLTSVLLSAGATVLNTPNGGTSTLSPAGYESVLLRGTGFGPPSGGVYALSVSYTGPNPSNPGGLLTYSAGVNAAQSNASAIIITTLPGVGANLTFTVTSAGGPPGYAAPTVVGVSGPVANYAAPVLAAFVPAPGSFAGGVSSINGGDTFTLTGNNFGPSSLPGLANYTPTVSIGASAGGSLVAANCFRAVATAQSSMTCHTPAGAGSGWLVQVCIGLTGWCSALSPSAVINYPAPVLNGLFGALRMSTAGGERIVATGTNLGTSASVGMYPVLLQYGPPSAPLLYSGANCVLESVSVSNTAVQVACTTVQGAGGAGFVIRATIGNTVTNTLPANVSNFGFAAPVIQSVTGPGAAAGSTLGGQGINITGLNFGTVNSTLNVTYSLSLQGQVPGVTVLRPDGTFSPNGVVYSPPGCAVTIPNTQITCNTAPGAGGSLSWTVIVNGVANAYPTTSYAPPAVSSFAIKDVSPFGGGLWVDITGAGADAGGNSTLIIWGSGFGVPSASPFGGIPLLQLVSLVSPSFALTALPPSAVQLVSDSQINCTLPPGSGAGWSVQVRVADHTSASTNATFSYALPAVTAVSCGGTGVNTIPTTGGVSCTVTGTNFPLADPLANLVVFFGNPADNSIIGTAIPTTPLPPSAVSFIVPAGVGIARTVRLVSYRNGDGVPNPANYVPAPAPATSLCSALAAVSGSGCVGTVSYAPPVVAAVVAQPTLGTGNWSRQLTIQGVNFGQGASALTEGSGTPVLFDVEYLSAPVGGVWVPVSGAFLIDPSSWTDRTIVVQSTMANATVRVAITSLTWSGAPVKVTSNAFTYVDLSPIVSVTNANPVSFPSVGYTSGSSALVQFTVQYLEAFNSLSVTVGGSLCPLVTNSGTLVTDAHAQLVQSSTYYAPANSSITPDTVWTLQCRVPPGQGANVPLIVTRWPDGTQSAANSSGGASGPQDWTLSYTAPVVSAATANAVSAVSGGSTRLFVAADGGTLVSVTGANLGTCPVVSFGGVMLPYCGSGCVCAGYPPSLIASAAMTLSSDQTTMTFVAPPFAGGASGSNASTGLSSANPSGYTMTVSAGGQAQSSVPILVGWSPPQVSSVVTTLIGSSTASLAWTPASASSRILVDADGGTIVAVSGTNLGACPVITFVYANYSYCGGSCVCDPADVAAGYTLTMAGGGGGAVLTFSAPPGAGNGTVACSNTAGWTMTVGDGRGQVAPPILVGWSAPTVTAVASLLVTASNGTNGFPSAGGVPITLTGFNFGVMTPFTPPSPCSLSASPVLALRVYVGRGPFVDPLAVATTTATASATPAPSSNCTVSSSSGSQCPSPSPTASSGSSAGSSSSSGSWSECTGVTVGVTVTPSGPVPSLTCTLPEGAGANKYVTVVSGGSAGTSPATVFSYNAPSVTAISSDYSGVPLTWMSPCNASDAPPVTGTSTTAYAAGSFPPGLTNATSLLRGPSPGCFIVHIGGQDFGPDMRSMTNGGGGGGNASSGGSGGVSASPRDCVFVASRSRDTTVPLQCSGTESFPGEGEVAQMWLLSWSHTAISFVMPHGLGDADIVVVADGQQQVVFSTPYFAYADPVVAPTALAPANGTTAGGTLVTVTGYNFGVAPSNVSYGPSGLPLPLPRSYMAPLHALRVNWGPQLGSIATTNPVGACISSSVDAAGNVPFVVSRCTPGLIIGVNHTAVQLLSLPGLGAWQPVSISVIDIDQPDYPNRAQPTARVFASDPSSPALWSYNGPRITSFLDVSGGTGFILVGGEGDELVRMNGYDFGSVALSTQFGYGTTPNQPQWMTVAIDGDFSLVDSVPQLTAVSSGSGGGGAVMTGADGSQAVTFTMLQSTPVGLHAVTVSVGGQPFTLPASAPNALLIGCNPNYFGRPGETCLPCPLGGLCDGYDPLSNTHTYPYAAAGFFNLNDTSNPAMTAACPNDKNGTLRPGACIVACFNPAACLEGNECAPGYTSSAPVFRCNSCAPGYYSINTQCTLCPSGGGPFALVVLFVLLVVLVGASAYVLNKRAIRISLLTIGLDYAQVVAMFATAQSSWTDNVKRLFLVLSALFLNVEIVAPECVAAYGAVTFPKKFAAVMLLPVVMAGAFLALHGALIFYKGVVLGRSKRLNRHAAPLIASLLLMMYVLYIYLCKMTFDVFDCQPSPTPPAFSGTSTTPADSTLAVDSSAGGLTIAYLQADKTPCRYARLGYASVAGGSQEMLLPVAIASLIVYVVGYPVALCYFLYKKRELIIEDQLLRAKGTGDDRLSNPNAYSLRRVFSGSYYQYRPDYYWWTGCILLRKFFIAFISLEFAQNASFQLGACQLVLLVAYCAHVACKPHMNVNDHSDVLKAHEVASFSDPLHARLRFKLQQIENRGRKHTRQNIMKPGGHIDAKALVGAVVAWAIDHNTVEGLLLLSAIAVALMGILFNASGVSGSTAYGDAVAWKNGLSGVVLAIVILSILYFVGVLAADLSMMWGDAARRAAVARGRAGSAKKLAVSAEDSTMAKANATRIFVGPRRGVSGRTSSGGSGFEVGAVDTSFNPIFVSSGAGSRAGDDFSTAGNKALADALAGSNAPPPPELWGTFRGSFMSMISQVDSLNEQLHAYKVAEQQRESEAEAASMQGVSPGMRKTSSSGGASAAKRQFGPTGASGSSRKLT